MTEERTQQTPVGVRGAGLLTEALAWLETNYRGHRFFNERDLAWTLQRWLLDHAETDGLLNRLFHDYLVALGARRAHPDRGAHWEGWATMLTDTYVW